MEGATYPDGTPVAMVAAIQNFGAPAAGIPARPFFSRMVQDKSSNWGRSLANIMVENDYAAKKSLALMGEGIGRQLQASIISFDSVPLDSATITKKGFDKQLIDTAVMINSVGYQVDDGNKQILPQVSTGKP